VMKFPENAWVHIEVSAGLGPQSTGTWDLAVAVPGPLPSAGAVTSYKGLKNASPEWKTLDWLGFCSLATQKTVFYLDNLELTDSAAQ